MSAQRKDEKFYIVCWDILISGPTVWFCKNQIVCLLLRILKFFGTFRIPVLIVVNMI